MHSSPEETQFLDWEKNYLIDEIVRDDETSPFVVVQFSGTALKHKASRTYYDIMAFLSQFGGLI